MDDQRRAVLERVARGELTPTEAASLLEELESKSEPERDPRDWAADWAQQPEGTPRPAPSGEGAARVRVLRSVGVADVVGDPSVREAVAEGPHVARREGDALVIQGTDGDIDWSGFQGFAFTWSGRPRPRPPRHLRHHGWGNMVPLLIRVNPDLPLEVESTAGKLRIRGVHAPIRANVQAGSTDIEDFRSTLDLNCQAGSVNARGRLDQGASRIQCSAGSVRIHLERGSSVRVSARSAMGKVTFHPGDARTPWVVGGGEATLDIDTTMGSVKVVAD